MENIEKVKKWVAHAQFFADTFSKDPSTKVGSYLLSEDGVILSRGYNGIPRELAETAERNDRTVSKYDVYEHAERNAIYNKARPLLKGSVLVTTGALTLSCVRAALSVGVSRLYIAHGVVDPLPGVSRELLMEGRVTVLQCPASPDGQPREMRKAMKFIDVLNHQAATVSKDPYATAAMFLTPDDFTQLTEGYSGFPRGADDSKVENYEGAARLTWVETSVRNAIYNLVRPFFKDSIGIVTATTCVECARGLACVGSKKVVYVEPSADLRSRWGDSFLEAVRLLEALNVSVTEIPYADMHKD